MAKNIDDLRRDRKAAADKMQEHADQIAALEEAEAPDEEALAKAQADFDAAEAAFAKAQKAVARAEATEAAQAAAAGAGDEGGAAGSVPAQAINPEHKGAEAALMVHALAASGGDKDKAVTRLEKTGYGAVAATLIGADESSGGVLIPRAQVSKVIPMLRAKTVLDKCGARPVPVSAGEMRNAKQTGRASAAYADEIGEAAESNPTYEPVSETLKDLKALVPVSNRLLERSDVAVAMMVLDDMLSAMALKRDIAGLRYDGTGLLPKGVRHWIPAGNWLATVDASSVALIDIALRSLVDKVEDADVMMLKPGWVMRASAKNFLASLKDNYGKPYYPEIDEKGMLKGYPIYTTSQVPKDLGVGGDETEITFGDWAELMIGEEDRIQIAQSREAAYRDSNGEFQSAFQQGKTLLLAVTANDFAPDHEEAFAGFNAQGWTLV
ncbi:phage major capsid protein [Celeribacter naphthalenivorans]|uniref:phage major capsid protein n=1 Tax=Celeribacter naphthalenivorans TaxID=1614694 RepID=UPI001CF9FC61|nr:phage major capsid protein [Celeribacter naphthalenivorans]